MVALNVNLRPYPQPINFPISDNDYRLYKPFTYTWKKADTIYRITIPQDFEYDGASVPPIFWGILKLRPDGLIRAAATVHDYMYEKRGDLGTNYQKLIGSNWETVQAPWSRRQADLLFGRMLREAGAHPVRRKLAFQAVNLFGGWAWKED